MPSRTSRVFLSAFLLLSISPVAVADQPFGPELVANGRFVDNLNPWFEEQHSNFTSNWNGESVAADGSGSLIGQGLDDDPPESNPIVWQCIDVVPGSEYVLKAAMRQASSHEIVSGIAGAFVTVHAAAAGGGCEMSGSSLARISNDASSTWLFGEKPFIPPGGVERVRVTAHVYRASPASQACCDEVNAMHFDGISVRQKRADLQLSYSPAVQAAILPREEISIRLQLRNASDHVARLTETRVLHAGRLSLVSYDCPGTVFDISQGSAHFFRWNGIGSLAPNSTTYCTIQARAASNPAGAFDLRATAFSENEANLANNEVVQTVQLQAAPDVNVSVSTTPFPAVGSTVQAQLTFLNQGTGTAATAITRFRWLNSTQSTVTLAGFTTSCPEFVYDAGVALAALDLAPGASKQCTLGFTFPGDHGSLDGRVEVQLAADYDPDDNVASDRSSLVSLVVNDTTDGIDAVPGDGVCARVQNQFPPICTLRGALMEANALPGVQFIEIPYPFGGTPYTLTRSSTAGSHFGDLRITEGVHLVGGDATLRPRLQLAFPAGEPARAFRITPSSGAYVRIENLEIVGQNLSYNGDGGLIEHAAGTLLLRNVSLAGGRSQGEGGALHSADELRLEQVEVSGNRAVFGGGIAFDPPTFDFLTIHDSHIHDNGDASTQYGGGLWSRNGLGGIDASTFDGNRAARGGAIAADAGNFGLLLWNSTIDGNDADLEGGGIWAGSAVALNVSTLSDNAATRGNDATGLGGGIFVTPGTTVAVYGSIVAANAAQTRTQTNGNLTLTFPHAAACHGALDSDGWNSVQPVTTDQLCSITATDGDVFNAFPNLAPLAENGGPTPTRALQTTGNEVDRGDPGCLRQPGGSALVEDQRGSERPADGDGDGNARCDKGAFERADAARVTITKSGDGGGLIVSTPASIFCGGTCSAAFASGASVTLSVQSVDAGSRFAGWSGACSGTQTSCNLVLAGQVQVGASFTRVVSRALDVSTSGPGSVSSSPGGIACPGDCSQSYDANTSVTLAAAPSAGASFLGWAGEGCSGTGLQCTVTLDVSRQISASFSLPLRNLSVGLGGDGSGTVAGASGEIACPDDCAAELPSATAVQLVASPTAGSEFDHWEGGACDGATLPTCQFGLDADTEVTAVFSTAAPPLLEIQRDGEGTVTSSPAGISCGQTCTAPFARDSTVTLQAGAATGHQFAEWLGGPCAGQTSPTCQVVMTESRKMRALFVPAGGPLPELVFRNGFE